MKRIERCEKLVRRRRFKKIRFAENFRSKNCLLHNLLFKILIKFVFSFYFFASLTIHPNENLNERVSNYKKKRICIKKKHAKRLIERERRTNKD